MTWSAARRRGVGDAEYAAEAPRLEMVWVETPFCGIKGCPAFGRWEVRDPKTQMTYGRFCLRHARRELALEGKPRG
jgi:hypothetical protein